MGDVAIHLQPPGRPWESLGRETYRGLYPQNVRVESDGSGFASAGFELPRSPHLPQPDLGMFVPCVIEEGAARLFEGRVVEAPGTGQEETISVSGRGYQYLFDDNPIEYAWRHTDLTAWKDVRSMISYNLTTWNGAGQVETGDGQIMFGSPRDTIWNAGQAVGVYLDLGPDVRARKISFSIDAPNVYNSSTFRLYCRGTTHKPPDTDNFFALPGTALTTSRIPTIVDNWGDAVLLLGGSVPFSLSPLHDAAGWFAPAARYIYLFLYWTAGASFTTLLDHLVTVKDLVVYTDGGYSRGKDTNLRASDAVADAIVKGSGYRIKVPRQTPDSTFLTERDVLMAGDTSPSIRHYRLANNTDSLGGPAFPTVVGSVAFNQSPGPISDGSGGVYMSLPTGAYVAHLRPLVKDFSAVFFMRSPVGANAGAIGGHWHQDPHAVYSARATAGLALSTEVDWGISVRDGVLAFGYGTWTGGSVRSFSRTEEVFAGINDGKWHFVCLAFEWASGTMQLHFDPGTRDEEERLEQTLGWSDSQGHPAKRKDPADASSCFGVFNGDATKKWIGDVAEYMLFPRFLSRRAAAELHHSMADRPQTKFRRTLLTLGDLHTTAPRTVRELADGANRYHRYLLKVGRDASAEFRPQPTLPLFSLTAAAARRFNNTSVITGDNTYNRALVVGALSDDTPLRVERLAAHQPGRRFITPTDLSRLNPSFDVDVSGAHYQGTAGGSIIRTTSGHVAGGFEYYTAPAGLQVTSPGGTANLSSVLLTFDGLFRRGRMYAITCMLRSEGASTWAITGQLGSLYFSDYRSLALGPLISDPTYSIGVPLWDQSNWFAHRFFWIPQRDYRCNSAKFVAGDPSDQPYLQINAPRSGVAGQIPATFFVDNIGVQVAVNSALDMQNDLRTRILEFGTPLTVQVAEQLADNFLRGAAKTPLRGSVPVGPGDLVRYGTGEPAHPSELVEHGGELLHLPGILDPDTGAEGRDGQIVNVSYSPSSADEIADVTLDSSRDHFEVLTQRMATNFSGGSALG